MILLIHTLEKDNKVLRKWDIIEFSQERRHGLNQVIHISIIN